MKKRPTKAERAYMDRVAQEPCVFKGPACYGDLELHHHGRKGLSQKVSHYRVVPLCTFHHLVQWHGKGTVYPHPRADADLIMTREQVRLLEMALRAA